MPLNVSYFITEGSPWTDDTDFLTRGGMERSLIDVAQGHDSGRAVGANPELCVTGGGLFR